VIQYPSFTVEPWCLRDVDVDVLTKARHCLRSPTDRFSGEETSMRETVLSVRLMFERRTRTSIAAYSETPYRFGLPEW